MEKVECEEEEKRSSEVIEIWWVGFIKDGAWPLSSSSDSVLARVTQLTPLKHKHTHTHTHETHGCSLPRTCSFLFRTHLQIFLTETEVSSKYCKSMHVDPYEMHTYTHSLSQSPNHSVTPPLLGSSFCLCFSSSMNFSCISSIEPSAGARSFSGKMSGKVNVWPSAS